MGVPGMIVMIVPYMVIMIVAIVVMPSAHACCFQIGSVFVAVMQIRVVRMSMTHRGMTVLMRVRLGYRPVMLVLVMAVMSMAVLMLQRHVFVTAF
jgi:hypothetical protein